VQGLAACRIGIELRMKRVLLGLQFVLAFFVLGAILWVGVRVHASSAGRRGVLRATWSPADAAHYLDYREAWWQTWPTAQLGRGTFCVSCHTALPYALVRPALRQQLNQAGLTSMEKTMLSNIEKRVTEWQDTRPYYTDPAHAEPSRSTEAVLNAVILAAYSADHNDSDSLTHSAFDHAWALQKTTGADAGGWDWQNFHEAPWESTESGYQGAALMAMAAGMMPGSYGSDPGVRNRVQLLRSYLNRSYPAQPVIDQIYALWASAYMSGLIGSAERDNLLVNIAKLQHPDGGWSLADLDPQRAFKRSVLDLFKRAENEDGSDGCATGLVVTALEESEGRLDDPMVQRGLAWLDGHQYQDGTWWAASLNGFRDPNSDLGRFMSDAATGYAVLALENARSLRAKGSSPRPSHSARNSSQPSSQITSKLSGKFTG
jgi:squalene-hopene/tetraprenyl-beta-curcumene cyclase